MVLGWHWKSYWSGCGVVSINYDMPTNLNALFFTFIGQQYDENGLAPSIYHGNLKVPDDG